MEQGRFSHCDSSFAGFASSKTQSIYIKQGDLAYWDVDALNILLEMISDYIWFI